MKRRTLLGTAAATLAMPNLARGASAKVIRFVPYVDLSLLDPVANTATPTRNHAYLVFDTLYGLDTEFRAHPQMVAGHTVDDAWTLWRLTLRDGLRFYDDTPVLARDAVASIRRWGVRDNFGQALMATTDALAATDDRTIEFRMKRPFPLLLDALAKVSPYMCPIMPERLANLDAFKPIEEMVGSGPFRFVADERLPGARAVYARFEGYVPRPNGTPSISAGPKIVHVDRVEWITIPDTATAAAALQQDQVDWLKAPNPDLIPTLRRNPSVRVEVKDRTGLTPILHFNCIQPPFDNPAIRRAVLRAANQTDFMQAYSANPSMWHVKLGVFARTRQWRRGSESVLFGLHKACGNNRPVGVGFRREGILCGRRRASPGQARWGRSGPRPSRVSQCGWPWPVISSRGLLPWRSARRLRRKRRWFRKNRSKSRYAPPRWRRRVK